MTVTYSVGLGGIGTVPLGDVVYLGDNPGYTSRADGEVGFSGVLISDPDGSLDIVGLNKFEVDDTACDNPRIYTGIVYDRTIKRGSQQRVETQRVWDTNLADQNAYLNLRIIHDGNHGNRPAETDVQRIAWLLAEVLNNGHVINGTGGTFGANGPTAAVLAAPRNLDAADYRGQYAAQVLADIGPPGNRRFFVYWDPVLDDKCLFYGLNTDYLGTSSLSISNVLADLDSTTFWPYFGDNGLHRDPSEVYGAVYYVYRNGTIYREDPGTLATYLNRGVSIRNDRVGSATTASTFTDRILDRASEERDQINVTIRVPPEHVNHVLEGQRIAVKFSHLPGYETETYLHVLSRTVIQDKPTPEFYDIRLELCDYVGGFGTGGSGGGSGAVAAPPFVPSTRPPDITMEFANTVLIDSGREGSATTVIPVVVGNTYYYEITNPQHSANAITDDFTLIGVAIAGAIPDGVHSGTIVPGGPGVWSAQGSADYGVGSPTVDEGWRVDVWAGGAPSTSIPNIGQTTTESFAGVTAGTDYTTNYPYAPGSLVVTVNGADVTPTEVDPDAGTFELGFDATGQTVVVTYQVASAVGTGSTNPQPTPSPTLPTSGVTDHGALTGLADDDHPQYATNVEFDDHSTRHDAGGADAMTIDAAAGTGSLRTLGTGATQAAVGSHTHAGIDPADATHVWMPLTTVVGGVPELVWDADDSLIPTLVPLE